MLHNYIHCFNLEKLEVGDSAMMEAFTNGLKNIDLIRPLYTHPPKNFDDTMSQAKTYMLADEAV